MITLHLLEESRGFRILWLLEEIGVDYRIVRHERNKKFFTAEPSLRDVHPLGKAPILEDDNSGELKTVVESAVIIEHIINHYAPHLKPDSDAEVQSQYSFWMHYSEGSLMSLLTTGYIFFKMLKTPMPFFARPVAIKIAETVRDVYIEPSLKSHIDFIEHHLETTEWFAGTELTGADFMMSFSLEGAIKKLAKNHPMPNSRLYLDRLRQRPAYQKALELNGELFSWT